MRLFGRKKNKQQKDVAGGGGGGKTTPAAPAPPPPESPLTVVRYVGETKHVTTTTVDELGRTVQQTRVFKLTADEMEELGIRPSRAAAALSESESLEYTQDYSVAPSEPYPMSDVFSASLPSQQHPPVPPSAPAPVPPPSNGTGTGMMSTPAAALDGDDDPNGGPSPAAIEVTRELVKKFISDIWNRGEVELIPVVCHPSLRFNGHVGMDRVGHNGFEMMVISVREALTDYHCEIHSMVVESNKAFCRLRFTGKHTGNLLGYPATGRGVAWMGASEFTCKNGKILKVWELGDLKSLEEQLKGNPVE